MGLKNLDIKRSYISYGDDNIPKAFLVPALRYAKSYQRSVGFFSSSVFLPIMDGIVSLFRNGGKIQLIASPQLSEEDIQAINLGYEKRDKVITDAATRDFMSSFQEFDEVKLQLLVDLIASGTLDIKIATLTSVGIYHDKLGIIKDLEGNAIVFFGSANSSINAYQNNYEKIRVVKSWDETENDVIEEEENEFESLWQGKNPYVNVLSYSESAKENLITIIHNKKTEAEDAKDPIKLRDYQEEAIAAWVANDYHGFYVMATGTGKTWTAIFSAKKLLEQHPAMVVICAPYKHLVRQWADDVIKAFPDAKIVMVSSENAKWESQLSDLIIRKKYQKDLQIIVISTIASFKMQRFNKALGYSREQKLLIVDEAHRFTERPDVLHKQFQYMLGLSATPFSGSSAQKGQELMKFFGGQVFSLPIESALERGFLVPYYYYPIYVNATDSEVAQFRSYNQKISSCFKNGRCINPDLLVKSLRGRLRVISMSSEKMENIDRIVDQIDEKDHIVVYCGDGKLFDDQTGAELRHIQAIKKVLAQHEYKASQFTATESMDDRMELVDAFNKGEITALAAIRCLDEGINIPSIKSALILSSNDDYREFVQRRGRILRLYKNKQYAKIYDVIVLPPNDMSAWAKIELRRYREYAHLALNWNELQDDLNSRLMEYGLTEEDVNVYDYEDMEVDVDE